MNFFDIILLLVLFTCWGVDAQHGILQKENPGADGGATQGALDLDGTTPAGALDSHLVTDGDVYKGQQHDIATVPSGNTTQGEPDDSTQNSPLKTKVNVKLTASKHLSYKIGIYTHLYYLPVVVVVGFVGNTLSLAVMLLKRNRRTTCCLYMAALAISDNISLFTALFARVVFSLPGGWGSYPVWCKCNGFSYMFASWYSILLVMVMTIDKFIAVTFPLKAPSLCTPGRAKIVIVILAIASLVYNSHHIILMKTVGKVCSAYGVKGTASEIFSWVGSALNFVIPFSTIFILNIFIIRALRNRSKYFKKTQNQLETSNNSKAGVSLKSSGQGQGQSRETQLTIMLLAVTFALFIFGLPIFLRHLIYTFIDPNTSAHSFSTYMLVFHVSNKLYWTNSAVNFFCYCISGSRFRRDVCHILGIDRCTGSESKDLEKSGIRTVSSALGSTSVVGGTPDTD